MQLQRLCEYSDLSPFLQLLIIKSESLPAVAAGVSFIVCIPAAFVTFPSEGLQVLSPRARTRIIAAGPFHNLVFWCILVLFGRVGAGSLAWSVIGYDNVGVSGKVVLDVDAVSC